MKHVAIEIVRERPSGKIVHLFPIVLGEIHELTGKQKGFVQVVEGKPVSVFEQDEILLLPVLG
jgi:hypothetical protein